MDDARAGLGRLDTKRLEPAVKPGPNAVPAALVQLELTDGLGAEIAANESSPVTTPLWMIKSAQTAHRVGLACKGARSGGASG
jgi:hypothetical protein